MTVKYVRGLNYSIAPGLLQKEPRLLASRGKGEPVFGQTVQDCKRFLDEQDYKDKFKSKLDRQLPYGVAKNILSGALAASIQSVRHLSWSLAKKILNEYARDIPATAALVNSFLTRNKPIDNQLFGVTWQELLDTVQPLPTPGRKTLSRQANRRPISDAAMTRYLRSGAYSNFLGSFPYEWLKNVPQTDRSNITYQLHNIFCCISKDLYIEPENIEYMIGGYAAAEIKYELSALLATDNAEFEVLTNASGAYGRVIRISVNGLECACKLYHSDLTESAAKQAESSNEPQNSIYCRNRRVVHGIKFNHIYASGLSNNRAERYVLGRFVPDSPGIDARINQMDGIKRFVLYGCHKENNRGGIATDFGSIKFNKNYPSNPRVQKIVRVIALHNMDAVGLVNVLVKYSKSEITDAIEFVRGGLSIDGTLVHSGGGKAIEDPEMDRVRWRVKYLETRMKTRS